VLCGTAEAAPFVHQRTSKLVANLFLLGQALFKSINKLNRQKGQLIRQFGQL
jgi:hypothetical protein